MSLRSSSVGSSLLPAKTISRRQTKSPRLSPRASERERTESLLALERDILQQVASNAPLGHILVSLTGLIEQHAAPVLASVLLLDDDGVHLRHGAAPSLPEAYNGAVDGLEIGMGQGSCGTAAFLKRQVIVTDTASDPLWEKYRAEAAHHGLRACWSTPILSTSGELLGTFALYYRDPRAPEPSDLQLIAMATHLASIAIERDRAHVRLSQREQQLAEAQRLAQLGSWEWNIKSNRVQWSDELYRIYGLQPQEFAATFEAYLDRVHPEDRNIARRIIENACQSGRPFSFTERIVRPDGSVRVLHSQGEVVADEKGAPFKLTGFCQDITDRARSEEALRESEQRYRAVVEQQSELVCRFNVDTILTFVNEAYCRYFGRTREQLMGQSFLSLIPDADAEEVRRHLRSLAANPRMMHYEHRVRATDGTLRWQQWIDSPILDGDGRVVEFLSVGRDITDHKRIGEERERLYRENEAARLRLQRLSLRLVDAQETERHRIAQELHDEIGQELTALKITLQMCQRMEPEQKKQAIDQAHARVGELLTKVREMSLDLRPAMLDDLGLLSALLWHFDRYTTQTGIQVQFKNHGLEGRRFAAEMETAAYRVIQEALTNVARHAGVKEVSVQVWVDQETLVVQVEDRGCGFNPDAALAAGTSSGLSGMRERASLLGGTLVIHSAFGEGTRLSAEFPFGGPLHRRKTPS